MPPSPNSFSADGPHATRTAACDGCHRISFQKCGTYPLPTTSQFNMCNCTARREHPQEIRHPSPDSDKAAHRPVIEGHPGHKKDRAGLGGVQRDRRRTLVTYQRSLGVGPVGAEPASLGAVVRTPRRVGGPTELSDIQLFRPRCAAAGCPRAVRGPQPRGNGGARRACGWT
jgi:hypothetical protein